MALKFGTSGLRGLVTEMTDLEVYVNVRGFLGYVGDVANVAIAEDLRASSGRIGLACAQAIRDAGAEPVHIGKVPTPALAATAIGRKMPGVMITGSHIPADRNGVKFYTAAGEVLKSDEAGILESVAKVRANPPDLFDDGGMFKAPPAAEPVDESAAEAYVDRYVSLFDRPLDGRRVVVYQHSAVGRDLLTRVLEGLGADVVPIERSDVFIAVDTEDVSVEEEKRYAALVNEHQAAALVSTDGDGDRPLVVDDSGRFRRGDVLGAVCARWLGADFAAIPVSTSDAVDRWFAGTDLEIVKTRIGSPWVIEAMSASSKKAIVGWEANGGFLLGSDFSLGKGSLSALPTRDAVLPIVAALLASKDSSVSALFADMPKRATRAGLLDDFPIPKSKHILSQVSPDSPEARAKLEQYFTKDHGFGSVTNIEDVDGVRVYFDNGDIAHLRPSGNAPQFRCYAVADTAERADHIVDLAIAEPDGILRKMERDLA